MKTILRLGMALVALSLAQFGCARRTAEGLQIDSAIVTYTPPGGLFSLREEDAGRNYTGMYASAVRRTLERRGAQVSDTAQWSVYGNIGIEAEFPLPYLYARFKLAGPSETLECKEKMYLFPFESIQHGLERIGGNVAEDLVDQWKERNLKNNQKTF